VSPSPSLCPALYHAVRKYLHNDNNDNINNNQGLEVNSFAYYKYDLAQIRFVIHIKLKSKNVGMLHIFAYLKF